MLTNPYQSPSLPASAGTNNPFTILMIVVWMLLAIPLGAAVSLIVALIGLMLTMEIRSDEIKVACLGIGFLSGLALITSCWYWGVRWFQKLLITDP